ncbi:MAG: hypothetical protein KKA42_11610 [candidate division Zixibacteria bacterium]|nr:hypothetical protein [candidate division Zixibacteria bacterium]
MMQILSTLATVAMTLVMSVSATADTGGIHTDQVDNSRPGHGIPATPQLAGETIPWQVLSSGGREGNSTSYTLNGTVGQTATGAGASGTYSLTHGYWRSPADAGCCIGSIGDVKLTPDCDDADQTVDISDLTNLINHLFIGFAPLCCEVEADVAPAIAGGVPDGSVDVGDLTAMIDHLFIGFPVMPTCP